MTVIAFATRLAHVATAAIALTAAVAVVVAGGENGWRRACEKRAKCKFQIWQKSNGLIMLDYKVYRSYPSNDEIQHKIF